VNWSERCIVQGWKIGGERIDPFGKGWGKHSGKRLALKPEKKKQRGRNEPSGMKERKSCNGP